MLGTLDAHHAFSDASTALCTMALLERPDDQTALAAVELGVIGPQRRHHGDLRAGRHVGEVRARQLDDEQIRTPAVGEVRAYFGAAS